jgi:hypothetical protein
LARDSDRPAATVSDDRVVALDGRLAQANDPVANGEPARPQ